MKKPEILCIGSVLWDVIGRTGETMRIGSDVGGHITRLPGGVALNIAMTLKRFQKTPALLSAVGTDAEGLELVAACDALGLATRYLYRPDHLPTDRYMAIEAANGVMAAIADAHSLENAGAHILEALSDGSLGSADAPYSGQIALDGNLTESLLQEISVSPLFAKADLRVAPASPGKAERLLPLLKHRSATLYVNLEEANLLSGIPCETSEAAALALLERGGGRVLVTDGAQSATDASATGVFTDRPPRVDVRRLTGAGDTFMAAHMAAESDGHTRAKALKAALDASAAYVSGKM